MSTQWSESLAFVWRPEGSDSILGEVTDVCYCGDSDWDETSI